MNTLLADVPSPDPALTVWTYLFYLAISMHFFNLYVFSRLRRRALQHRAMPPPIPHSQVKPI